MTQSSCVITWDGVHTKLHAHNGLQPRFIAFDIEEHIPSMKLGTTLLRGKAFSALEAPSMVFIKIVERDDLADQEVESMRASSWITSIVPLLEAYTDCNYKYVYFVTPYLPGGDLFDRVKDRGLTTPEAQHYLRHIVEGLLCLKSIGYTHGDISVENVMIQGSRGRLIDLGSAWSRHHAGEYRYMGKDVYIAPELIVTTQNALDPFAIDVWALGVCLYIMLTRRPLYRRIRDGLHRKVCEVGVRPLIETWGTVKDNGALDLICGMLDVDPKTRMTLEDVACHPWTLSRCTESCLSKKY